MIRSFVETVRQSRLLLGRNARNLEFTRLNARHARHIADNKLLAKHVLEEEGIATPKTYAVIGSQQQLQDFNPECLPKSFVLKPNRGLGGEGIIFTYSQKRTGVWIDNEFREISWRDISSHVQDILDGRFSLADMPDIAFFEERLIKESVFKDLAYRGVPDIRVVVYNKVPIMAMMRLPTKESRGKANLHLGGIGVGIDIAEGVTTYSIRRGALLPKMQQYYGIKIPDWDGILLLAIRAAEAMNLGYAGVDIVLAKKNGPVVLEVNARPGLSIQVANLAGLKERLFKVRGLVVSSDEEGIQLAREFFGESSVSRTSFRTEASVINVIETVILHHESDALLKVPVQARVDSGAHSSSLDYELARRMGYGEVVDYIKPYLLDSPMTPRKAKKIKKKIKKDLKSHPKIKKIMLVHSASGSTIRVAIPMRFQLKGRVIESEINLISREHLTYDMIIGRRDLRGFLIKPPA